MPRYVTIAAALLIIKIFECAPLPLRLTIDCGSNEEDYQPMFRSSSTELLGTSYFDVDSFCAMIQRAIPKAVIDGRFVPVEPEYDQSVYADSQAPLAIAPPKGFVPRLGLHKLKTPKLGIPKITVPKLKPLHKPSKAPLVGSPMAIASFKVNVDEETSAEKMEKFKKGVQKLLHVVKVLGQIDRYLSDRTRIVVDKLSKTFSD
ncbi:uncharacterized protein [Battus philenor]|uniref:uncharacterized protein n=1 Tax=Battus philenor TaxID=42288 RepID=UPI0035D053A3